MEWFKISTIKKRSEPLIDSLITPLPSPVPNLGQSALTRNVSLSGCHSFKCLLTSCDNDKLLLSGKSNNIYLPEKTKEILSYDFLRLYALEGHTIFAPSCIKRIGRNGIMADHVKFENDYCEVEYIDDYGVFANSKNEIYAPNLKFLG